MDGWKRMERCKKGRERDEQGRQSKKSRRIGENRGCLDWRVVEDGVESSRYLLDIYLWKKNFDDSARC